MRGCRRIRCETVSALKRKRAWGRSKRSPRCSGINPPKRKSTMAEGKGAAVACRLSLLRSVAVWSLSRFALTVVRELALLRSRRRRSKALWGFHPHAPACRKILPRARITRAHARTRGLFFADQPKKGLAVGQTLLPCRGCRGVAKPPCGVLVSYPPAPDIVKNIYFFVLYHPVIQKRGVMCHWVIHSVSPGDTVA